MTPDEHTNQEFWLDVGGGQRVYVHDWGKADAKLPIVFLHGGPGNGCDNRDKRKFDPAEQRVIFHDQRGAGKSTPYASLENNTTQDLVEDIEKLAEQLKLDRFIVVGGSWGSTLALMYGIAYPERVAGMVLNGVFTATQEEMDWLAKGGYRHMFPDVWEQYLEATPPSHHENPTAYHYKQALGGDPEAAKKSAHTYQIMEISLLKLDDQFAPPEWDDYDPAKIRTEMHFGANKWFIKDKYILNNAAKLTMPVWLVQGRYDIVCPPIFAYRLHKTLPDSRLIWTINGHLAQHESANIQQLLIQRLSENA
jgi:proline iminopeptidase